MTAAKTVVTKNVIYITVIKETVLLFKGWKMLTVLISFWGVMDDVNVFLIFSTFEQSVWITL